MSSVYVTTFMQEKAKIGLDITQTKLKRNKLLDEELADFFRERAAIEESYSKQLQKLAKKHLLSDRLMFNGFEQAFEEIQNDLNKVANKHNYLAQALVKNVERPIRESTHFLSETGHLRLVETNVQRLIKEYEEKTIKIGKLQKVAEKSKTKNKESAQKVVDLSQSLEETRLQLESELKRYYEQSEFVDVSRLETFKKAFTNYHTFQIQNFTKLNEHLETTHNLVKDLDVGNQITQFCTEYKSLNLTTTAQVGSIKLGSKIENSAFGSWMLRPRKNSGINTGAVVSASDSSLKDGKSEVFSIDSKEEPNHQPTSIQVDEEGYTIPPNPTLESNSLDHPNLKHSDDDDYSEGSSHHPASTKVKFDIRDTVIEEDPNATATAIRNLTSTLRQPTPSKRKPNRGRKDRLEPGERPISSFPHRTEPNRAHATLVELGTHPKHRPQSEFLTPTELNPPEPYLSYWVEHVVRLVYNHQKPNQLQLVGSMFVQVHRSDFQTIAKIPIHILPHFQSVPVQVVVDKQFLVEQEPGRYHLRQESLPLLLNQPHLVLKYQLQTLHLDDQRIDQFVPIQIQTCLAYQGRFGYLGLLIQPKGPVQTERLTLATQIEPSPGIQTNWIPSWNQELELIWDQPPDGLINLLLKQQSKFTSPFILQFDLVCKQFHRANSILSFQLEDWAKVRLQFVRYTSKQSFLWLDTPLESSKDHLEGLPV